MSTPEKIFLIVSLSLVALAILAIVFPIIRRAYIRGKLVPHFGKKIYKVALYHDYYLINQIKLPIGEGDFANIDHLLFGEKFIYLIKDRYYDGAIKGDAKDANWTFFPRFSLKSKLVPNPILKNKIRLDKLSLITGLDGQLFINVIVINDRCLINEMNTDDKATYVIKLSKLEKLILAIEQRDIPIINQEQLDAAVKAIYQLVKGKENV